MRKKILVLSLVISMIFSCNSVASASEVSSSATVDSTINSESSDVTFDGCQTANESKAAQIKETIITTLDDVKLDKDNGKIKIPSREKLKNDLLKHYNKEPKKQAENIANIDSIVDSYVEYFNNYSTYDIVAQDFRLYPHTHYWHIAPHQDNMEKHIAYSSSWMSIDCFHSAGPLTLTVANSSTISFTIGLGGSAKITDYLSLTGNWSETHTNTKTVTSGTTANAWEYRAWRPYSRYEIYFYSGVENTEYYNVLDGTYVCESRPYSATKSNLLDDTYESYYAINSTHNMNLSTPLPSSGCPNAWW